MRLNLFLIVITSFTLAGSIFFFKGVILFKKIQDFKKWPNTRGMVVSAEMDKYKTNREVKSSGSDSYRTERYWIYRANVTYRYNVEGKQYTSDKISFMETTNADSSVIEGVVNQYLKNRDVTVYYNPKNPQEAVLEASNHNEIVLYTFFGGVLLIVSIVMTFVKMVFWLIDNGYFNVGNTFSKLVK